MSQENEVQLQEAKNSPYSIKQCDCINKELCKHGQLNLLGPCRKCGGNNFKFYGVYRKCIDCKREYDKLNRPRRTDWPNKGKICKASECQTQAFCKGYCVKHYNRFVIYGSVEDDIMSNGPPGAGSYKVKKQCVCDGAGTCSTCTARQRAIANKRRSKNQESQIAKSYQKLGFNARRVPMSGAIKGMPGDVEVGDLLLVEAKITTKPSMTIKHQWISKIAEQSKQAGKRHWALECWIKEQGENYTKVVVIPHKLFLELLSLEP